jgi:hypothetical protein
MRLRRGFLFWGIFFILLGGIRLAARQGWIDASQWVQRHLTKSSTVWHRAGSGGSTIHLKIEGNAASFTLNPSGGCR